jgi:serine/threonine-protein kinase RsbW|tara:strand:+ start:349 stop:795 length:447 start_codon:yes stop_codon:yes gene_type:complete
VKAEGVVELLIPARPEYLQLVRTVVGETAAVDLGLDAERIADLRLAVSEAVTNAIEAQVMSGADDRVVVRCNLAAEQIEIEVTDRGEGFDPDGVRALPDVESPERLEYESGLGLSLMRRLADETTVETSVDGTAVRLVVRFAGTTDET